MSGCGIILYTKMYGKTKYLGLLVEESIAKKNKGKWDLPKGTQESHELPVETAIRETYEETGILISKKNISKDFLEIGKLKMYYAETNLVPKIQPNPDSGIIEHLGYQWLEDTELYANCFIWLKPFVKWISKKQL